VLGDKIGEESGRVIGTRVLASDTGPKMEITYQMQATFLGVEGTDTATYSNVLRSNGTLHGEGNGVVMTAEGPATWTGAGVGHPTGEGMGATFRGAVYFETRSAALDRLNHSAAVYEFSVDGDGNCRCDFWEWS
jgi:hypothetical protein